jgi:hypothetical protein
MCVWAVIRRCNCCRRSCLHSRAAMEFGPGRMSDDDAAMSLVFPSWAADCECAARVGRSVIGWCVVRGVREATVCCRRRSRRRGVR